MKRSLFISSSVLLISIFASEQADADINRNFETITSDDLQQQVGIPFSNQLVTTDNRPKVVNLTLEYKGTEKNANAIVSSDSDQANIENVTLMLNVIQNLSSFRNRAENKTVYQYAQEFDNFSLAERQNFKNSFVSEDFVKAIIKTILENPQVYNNIQVLDVDGSQISGSHITDDSNPVNDRVYQFTYLYNDSLIISYSGTSGDLEWDDNALQLLVPDTPQQIRALNYFDTQVQKYPQAKNVYVTGQSKGGNKAMYVTTLRYQQVTHAYVFQSQGFTKEFINKYQNQIKTAATKITNIADAEDYVNILYKQITTDRQYVASSTNYRNLLEFIDKTRQTGESMIDYLARISLKLFGVRVASAHAPVSMMTINRQGTISFGKTASQNDFFNFLQKLFAYIQDRVTTDEFYWGATKIVSLLMTNPESYYPANPNQDQRYAAAWLNQIGNYLKENSNFLSSAKTISGLFKFIFAI